MSQWKGYGPDNVLTSDQAASDAGPQSAANTGALTYEPHFGLKTKPFSLSTDPRTLYPSPVHAQVLDDLLEGIRRREGLIVLTGGMGTGKTTLCRAALYQLDRKTFTAFVPDPFLSREDLLRMLLVDFGEVSVDELRRGRLSGASRPDLSYQLYEFLTSLESVDAFAVLVIDEAQHLAPPLLDEIRALSELEAGRRLLQIVLVGQPELQSHLKQWQMRQIDQRVTLRCELHPLTREDIAGYVAHRLAAAGGTEERVAFASAAIDLIHAASNGVPRIVNIICDRALSRAHLERTSVVGPPIVAHAIGDLQLAASTQTNDPARPTRHERQAVPVPTPPKRAGARGLFEKKAAAPSAAAVSELHALLDLPTVERRREVFPSQLQAGAKTGPVGKWRIESEVRRGNRIALLKNAGLAVVGMAVLLIAGGIAVTAQRSRPQMATPSVSPVPGQSATVAGAASETATPASVTAQPPSAAAPPVAMPALRDMWVVQVAAFSSAERAAALVQRLTQAGFAAFEVGADPQSGGGLRFVRVGPFKTAAEADDMRAKIGKLSELEGAFVRSVIAAP